jgi:hypothetical protein
MALQRFGRHAPLEDAADSLLRASTDGWKEKCDIMSPRRERRVKEREIYVNSGVAEPTNREGLFRRSANATRPDLNSRNRSRPPARGMSDSLSTFVAEHTAMDRVWNDGTP